MIKLENTEVYGWEAAIRGMRNPMNSWEQSDSGYGCVDQLCENCNFNHGWCGNAGKYKIGEKDLDLMKRLVKAGSDHSKFMRMINVTVDITAPLYWIAEHDTYKVGTVRNSCSFMHKGVSSPFTINDFSVHDFPIHDDRIYENIIDALNQLRNEYLETKDENVFQQIRCLLPSGYNQRYTWQANYAVLRNIYHARKNHRLQEWRTFCAWIESLPYSELITM